MHLPSLATQIGSLVHAVDRLERAHSILLLPPLAEPQAASYLADEVLTLHGVIDGLNALYEGQADRERELAQQLDASRHDAQRLRFLLWHRHYHRSDPLTAEEQTHMALGAPLEANA